MVGKTFSLIVIIACSSSIWNVVFGRLPVGCDPRQSCFGSSSSCTYFSFCSDILGVVHAVLHQSIPCLLGIMISESVLVGEAVLTSILWVWLLKMCTVFGRWVGLNPAGFTVLSLRAPAAMPDQCIHSSDRRCSTSPWLSRWPAPCQTEPQTWKLLSDSRRYC